MKEQVPSSQEHEQLRLLEIFHYIWGTISCLMGLAGVAYIQLGFAMMSSRLNGNLASDNFTLMFGRLWIAFAVFGLVLFEISGVLSLIAGWRYRKRKSYRFCFMVAVVDCFLAPIGTALGAFSLFVLIRPSVKALFQAPPGSPLLGDEHLPEQ
jgi:hypothetical protein